MLRLLVLSFYVLVSFMLTSAGAQTSAKWVTAPAPSTTTGYVSITFDDATRSQFTAGFPILVRYGLPATLFVSTGPVDQGDPFFMNWDEVRLVAAAGWEIGAHTVTHRALPTLDDVTVVGELALARDRIEREVGTVPRTFASPFGEYDERTLAHIARYFPHHVRAWGDQAGKNPHSVDPLHIERVNVDGTLTAYEVCGMVRTVGAGEWLVLMLHQVAEPGGAYTIAPLQLEAIARCIKDAVSRGTLTADTVLAVMQTLNK